MKTIWKFPLEIIGRQEIHVPQNARILCVQYQIGVGPCVWVELDPQREPEPRTIYIVGTGHPMPFDEGTYIGTVQIDRLVWHVYQ